MLSVDWFIEPPMDFEQKNYLLLDYVQQIDNSFKVQKLSPYILHTEKLIEEMNRFKENRLRMRDALRKKKLNLSRKIHWIVTEVDETVEMKAVVEVVDYSMPILESKLVLGYKLLEKYPQILWA
jgi:chromosome condensin MukBEF ATPase and DNA-binding subunit MukB